MKFRKIPVEIEAEQYHERSLGDDLPGVCRCLNGGLLAHVHTIHSHQSIRLADGDWIIPEPDGIHFYPVKDEIFLKTYEPVEG